MPPLLNLSFSTILLQVRRSTNSDKSSPKLQMSRLTVCGLTLLAVVVAGAAAQQEISQQQIPEVLLYLPADVVPETVQINYFMTGPFGGYGSFVRTEQGLVLYEIPAGVDGKPAANVKIIAFIPGCEIATLDIAMQGASQTRTLGCSSLETIRLQGRILPAALVQGPGSEVAINYEADWDHAFFGIADGMVSTVHIATVIPDKDGRFEVELPDYFQQSGLGKGEFLFSLSNKSGRVVSLKPRNMPQFDLGLEVLSSYAPFVLFAADTSESTSVASGSEGDKKE